ncbi:MAG: hypothetical protein K0U41_02155 [Gammaproteobacteria bacterium]|nr:hypothetical protein [Gammaproteobacteria bacterium]
MGQILRTDFNYYANSEGRTPTDGLGNNLGYYRYETLENVVNNFIALNTGEDTVIGKVNRNKVVGIAKRGIQQFTYDIIRSEKSIQLDLRTDILAVPLPQDYVNYVKISFIDQDGQEHAIQPAIDVNSGVDIAQEDDCTYLYDSDGRLIELNPAASITRFQDPTPVGSGGLAGLQGYVYGQFNDDEYSQFSPYSFSRRYGLNPEKENINGYFTIDHVKGLIYFSSAFAMQDNTGADGVKVKIDYISDGLGVTETEIQINKLAEEALYKWIEYHIISKKMPAVQEFIIRRVKGEMHTEMRNAKHRMSNLNLHEIAQVMKGQSKWIKH